MEMSDYTIEEISQIAKEIKTVHRQAYRVYLPLTEDICSRIAAEDEAEYLPDLFHDPDAVQKPSVKQLYEGYRVMMDKNELVIFETKDREVTIPVLVREDTVWLTQAQMTQLFDVDRTVITRHVNNVFKEHELDRESNVQILHIANSDRPVKHYNLDVIISVGYRVKSKRGVEFRKWANNVLKQYIIQGYAVNANITKKQLQEKLGLGKSTVDLGIKALRESGIIERIGSNKTGYRKIAE